METCNVKSKYGKGEEIKLKCNLISQIIFHLFPISMHKAYFI